MPKIRPLDKYPKYHNKKSDDIIISKTSERTMIELYNAGVSMEEIAKQFGLDVKDIKDLFPVDCTEKPEQFIGRNEALIAEVIDNKPIEYTKENIEELEKRRYNKYSIIEDKALDMMIKLLGFYDRVENGDLEIDRFKAHLAVSLIRATQLSREELLQRFKLENKQKQNKIKVEFISRGVKRSKDEKNDD